jgi:DNA-directed RNA polymerase subunit RPC12/RpoP
MSRCEDYPCCGHGPPTGISPGDGGGCPDDNGRFKCVECGKKLPKNGTSAICVRCRSKYLNMDPEEREYRDYMRDQQET